MNEQKEGFLKRKEDVERKEGRKERRKEGNVGYSTNCRIEYKQANQSSQASRNSDKKASTTRENEKINNEFIVITFFFLCLCLFWVSPHGLILNES